MLTRFYPLVSQRFVAAVVSGCLFLLLSLVLQPLSQKYSVTAKVDAPTGGDFLSLDGAAESELISVRPDAVPGRWVVDVNAASELAARDSFDAMIDAWRDKLEKMNEYELETITVEKSRLEALRLTLEAEMLGKAEAERRIEAFDAAALAVRARIKAAKDNTLRNKDEFSDPLGSLVDSGRALQSVLAEALPSDHPSLVNLSGELAQMEAASISQSQAVEVARRLALFASQLRALLKRYSPSHPEVLRKAAEVNSIAVRLKELRSEGIPIVPLYGDLDKSWKDKDYWAAELKALENEKDKQLEKLKKFEDLETEVAALEAIVVGKEKVRKSTRGVVVVAGPHGEPTYNLPRSWHVWSLAMSLCVGLSAAFISHGEGRRVWSPEKLKQLLKDDAVDVFAASIMPTPRARRMSVLKAALALLPWVVVFSVLSLNLG